VKRVVLAAALAVGVLFGSGGSASACATYCDWDPLVPIVTPAGHIVLLYDSVWTPSLLNLGLPLESHTVSRVYGEDDEPMTKVDATIWTPTGLLFRYQTMDEITTGLLGSGRVLARGYGWSGRSVNLTFYLPEA
jgi:hypothetical protein